MSLAQLLGLFGHAIYGNEIEKFLIGFKILTKIRILSVLSLKIFAILPTQISN